MLSDKLSKRFKAGETLYGPFAELDNPNVVEMFGLAGFDFVLIDCEHGPGGSDLALELLRAADCRSLPAIVRVPNAMPSTVLKFLDIGSDGVMVPLVHTAETARQVAEAARYHPRGKRGFATMRAADWGFVDVPSHIARTNAKAFVMVQAESVEAIDNIEAIAATEGIDSIFVGTFDLSQSMGIPGQVTDARMTAAVKKAVKAIRGAGKVPGIYAGSVEIAKRYAALGFQLIAFSSDVGLMVNACKAAVKALRIGKR
ncbi:MAG: 4-hydroxy-2-oxovalerate aldolase [Planctomycetota bacterium]|jgi:4-hydroxy-2-oxoheptanedioate aldolase|nr:4-hydroxy-2-oxovalerate aldolase [Planctomycetota bacterium]